MGIPRMSLPVLQTLSLLLLLLSLTSSSSSSLWPSDREDERILESLDIIQRLVSTNLPKPFLAGTLKLYRSAIPLSIPPLLQSRRIRTTTDTKAQVREAKTRRRDTSTSSYRSGKNFRWMTI